MLYLKPGRYLVPEKPTPSPCQLAQILTCPR
jgi:hypothetical protein